MASRIPTAQNVRKFTPGAPRAANAPASAFGGQVGAALQELGAAGTKAARDVEEVAFKQQTDFETAEAQDGSNKYSAFSREIEREYSALTGMEAVKRRKEFEDKLAREKERVLGATSSDRVQDLLRGPLNNKFNGTASKLDGWSLTQMKAFQDATDNDTIDQGHQNAINDSLNPTAVARHIRDIYAASVKIGMRKFGDRKLAESFADKEVSKTHIAVITDLNERDPAAAKKYFVKNKSGIKPNARAATLESIDKEVLRKQSQTKSDAIMVEAEDKGWTPAQIRDKAREIKDEKLRDEVLRRVKIQIAENDADNTRAKLEAKNKAWEIIDNGGSVDNLPQPVRSLIDGNTLGSMDRFVARRLSKTQGFAEVTDNATDNKLFNLLLSDRAAFAKFDINSVRDKLEEDDFKLWRNRILAVDTKAEAEAKRAPSYTLGARIANEYLDAAQIKRGSSAGTADAGRTREVYRAMRDLVDQHEKDGKPRPTTEEFNVLFSEMFLKVDKDGGFVVYGDEKPAFLIEDAVNKNIVDIKEQKEAVSFATDIPEDEVLKYAKALTKAGLQVTLRNLRDLRAKRNP